MSGHALEVHAAASELGGFVARCSGCPGWESRPEMNRPDAIRHFTMHTAGAYSANALGLVPVAVTGYEVGRRGESRPLVDYRDALIPDARPSVRTKARRGVNVDRILTRVVGPIVFFSALGFGFYAGMVPA